MLSNCCKYVFSSRSGISRGHVFNAKDMLLDVTVSPRGVRSIIRLSALVENVELTVGYMIHEMQVTQRYLFLCAVQFDRKGVLTRNSNNTERSFGLKQNTDQRLITS